MTASTVDLFNPTLPDQLKPGLIGGKEKTFGFVVTVPTTSIDEVGDVFMVCEIPKQFKVHSVMIFNDDMDSNGAPTLAVDVGLYDKDNVVVDADFFASAITTLQAANKTGVEIAFESGVHTFLKSLDTVGNAQSTADGNGGKYKIGCTVTAAAATAVQGTLKIVVRGVDC